VSNQIQQYLPVGLLLLLAVGMAVGMIAVTWLLGQKGKRNRIKDTAYECGKPEISDPHSRFSVKFYLVAMLFILFDIEVVFLYPWAVVFLDFLKESGAGILWLMLFFLVVLEIGFLWVWKMGALDWNARG
jgi:NADH-quinone oxidoreductase subunit A